MPQLYLHGHPIPTVFDLLGEKENDLTYSIGWALASSERFLRAFLLDLVPNRDLGIVESIRLQSGTKSGLNGAHGGYTDIEILTSTVHVIIEAKRGWCVPSDQQLLRYVPRFKGGAQRPILVALAECSDAYAVPLLPGRLGTVTVQYVSWRRLWEIALKSRHGATLAEKRLLAEVAKYLQGLMSMQNIDSNLVYVVALGADTPVWSSLSWREIIKKKRRYFCLFGVPHWPKEPPNYVGFRYDGRLQSIHHVEDYVIALGGKQMHAEIPEVHARLWDKKNPKAKVPHFIFRLGPPIVPAKEVRTGGIYRNGRVKAALDLLLTCKTVAEASHRTRARYKDA